MEKKEKGDIRMKLTGFTVCVQGHQGDHISALGGQQTGKFHYNIDFIPRFPYLVTGEVFQSFVTAVLNKKLIKYF